MFNALTPSCPSFPWKIVKIHRNYTNPRDPYVTAGPQTLYPAAPERLAVRLAVRKQVPAVMCSSVAGDASWAMVGWLWQQQNSADRWAMFVVVVHSSPLATCTTTTSTMMTRDLPRVDLTIDDTDWRVLLLLLVVVIYLHEKSNMNINQYKLIWNG